MRLAILRTSSDAQPDSTRRRGTALILTLLAHALLLWMLIRLAPEYAAMNGGVTRLLTFNVAPEAKEPSPHKSAPTAKAAKARTAPPSKPTELQHVTDHPAAWSLPLAPGLEHFDLAKVDRYQRPAQAGDAGNADAADGGGGSAGGQTGPHGERLYNARWYREPTDAEIRTYLPKSVQPGSWALIACQTVARFHVENCVELGDSPAGSGLARAMRQAAWQFLVYPPRIGGQYEIGTWVRIRIDWNENGVK